MSRHPIRCGALGVVRSRPGTPARPRDRCIGPAGRRCRPRGAGRGRRDQVVPGQGSDGQPVSGRASRVGFSGRLLQPPRSAVGAVRRLGECHRGSSGRRGAGRPAGASSTGAPARGAGAASPTAPAVESVAVSGAAGRCGRRCRPCPHRVAPRLAVAVGCETRGPFAGPGERPTDLAAGQLLHRGRGRFSRERPRGGDVLHRCLRQVYRSTGRRGRRVTRPPSAPVSISSAKGRSWTR
jgi:hypothetical protein